MTDVNRTISALDKNKKDSYKNGSKQKKFNYTF